MSNLNFDVMLDNVLSWWPKELNGNDEDYADNLKSSSAAIYYEKFIASASLNSGSMLLIQLDWIVWSVVDELSRRSMVVRPHEIRRQFVRDRFNKLLREIAFPQLSGHKEWDDSFDKNVLSAYISCNEINT